MRGSGREEVASVERPRDALESVRRVGELVREGDPAVAVDCGKQQPVVRTDVQAPLAVLQDERPT